MYEPTVPTLVVGNLHSGGSGKTPIVVAIAERFAELRPVIVSRGYKGQLSKVGARVDRSQADGPRIYGDEPWMLAQRVAVPVHVGRNRGAALNKAQAEFPGFFLLDDAFQNLSFRHDTDLVVIQTDRPLEESCCIPLGDLREPFSALASAQAVVLAGDPQSPGRKAWEGFLRKRFPRLVIFPAHPEVQGIWGADGRVEVGKSLQWGAFSGIAFPERFRKSLRGWVEPVFFESFADHHAYDEADIDSLLARKRKFDAHHMVTTEKDWHKAFALFQARSQPLYYLRIGYVFSEEFWYFLKTRLESA